MIDYTQLINMELAGIYRDTVLKDLKEIIESYEFYEGKGQNWETDYLELDYEPTQLRTNKTKKLIKEEARFMFSRTPEITIIPHDKKADEERAEKLQKVINKVLEDTNFSSKLVKGARDCFIGKRVALKLHADKNTKKIKIIFRPSLEFVFDTDPDDTDTLQKIIFFYSQNNELDKEKQRLWKQKYEIVKGKCILTEGVYNGYGALIESRFDNYNTNLDFIPAIVIINDGLTGDLSGESDVEEIRGNQDSYNKLKSDDIDALKFNMFPQNVSINANEDSLKDIKIAPGALIDLQAENDEIAVDMKKLEANFNYDSKYENTINRINNDMYDLLSIPNVGLEQLKGLMQSGKSMKALYWQLITRCSEKWATWEPALRWMVKTIIQLYKLYVDKSLDIDFDYTIKIDLMYSILEDDEVERKSDLEEVTAQVRSRKNYIQKWGIAQDAEEELLQIAKEQELLDQLKGIKELDGELE